MTTTTENTRPVNADTLTVIGYTLTTGGGGFAPHLPVVAATVTLGTADPTLDAMQAAVGGYIETLFRLDSPEREGVTIDAYCNEEGRLIPGVPVLGLLVPAEHSDEPAEVVVAGPVLFTAANPETGDSIPLTEGEARWLDENIMRHAQVLGLTRGY